ncbi:MAG TPA: hypothetical protein VIL20_19125 [Sandaracinaceae bacterium]
MRGSERTRAGLALALLFGVLASRPALAQHDDVERTALARALFRRGVELSDAGRWAEAADHFRRSLALRESPVVVFNLATALRHTGRLVEATELFRRAARSERAPEELREAAHSQVEALAPRLGALTVEAEGPLESVELRLDGERLPREVIGVTTPADPGPHVLAALCGGVEVARARVEVPEGGSASVRLVVPPAPRVTELDAPSREGEPRVVRTEAPVRPDAPPPAGSDGALVALGLVLGVVAVGAAVAITTAVVLESQGPEPPVEGNLGPPVIVFE